MLLGKAIKHLLLMFFLIKTRYLSRKLFKIYKQLEGSFPYTPVEELLMFVLTTRDCIPLEKLRLMYYETFVSTATRSSVMICELVKTLLRNEYFESKYMRIIDKEEWVIFNELEMIYTIIGEEYCKSDGYRNVNIFSLHEMFRLSIYGTASLQLMRYANEQYPEREKEDLYKKVLLLNPGLSDQMADTIIASAKSAAQKMNELLSFQGIVIILIMHNAMQRKGKGLSPLENSEITRGVSMIIPRDL